ncbi:MAG: undecaprenyldiphospho-muramoylpentapeptide beta-N-acetylglucosaminyltransferase [Proteobacteria bacterium]|nr:undecaprenyldiphospho-muramoylpentapeptide beta-N-acetylglucosaminyltransferase [Pseudomonadota bacterium]
MRILIIAGGTGGHIFPALAVADLLKKKGLEVFWLGSEVGLEKNIIPDRFPLICIPAQRLRGKGLKALLAAPWNITSSTWQAWKIIHKLKPAAVLAMGGFVCGPGGMAAKLARIPLIIHEQNAISGYTNRMLSKIADQVICAYPDVFPGAKAIGNPVRANIVAVAQPVDRLAHRRGPLRVLILGGSQGAHALNELVSQMVLSFPSPDKIEIWHQTGKKDYAVIHDRYQQSQITAKAQAFIDDMATAYQWADLLIARAGALTVAEITAVGIASILVPFPAAVDDHQWYNARYLEQAGAAKLIRESDLTLTQLSALVIQFEQDRSLLVAMAQKARDLYQADSAQILTEIVLKKAKNQILI